MKLQLIALFLALSVPYHALSAKAKYFEDAYRDAWCDEHGIGNEVRMYNGTRVDCITETHAVEVDFAYKWAEAIGQAVNGANQTGLRPGILLILELPNDTRYLDRLKDNLNVCVMDASPEGWNCKRIDVFTTRPEDIDDDDSM